MLKYLHKFYNHHDIPWVKLVWDTYYHEVVPHATALCGSFWWRDIFKLAEKYCLIAKPLISDGKSVLFWKDIWAVASGSFSLASCFPRLFSYVIDSQTCVADILSSELISALHLPLSSEAFAEFNVMSQMLQNCQLVEGNDAWIWPFNKGSYRPKSFYMHEHANIVADPIFQWIWKCSCTLKIKMFGWLLLMDRLNTRDMLQRRHWHVDDDTCVLCPSNIHEDIVHLFFSCTFSQRVWNYLQVDWSPNQNMTTYQMAVAARQDFGKPFFTEVVFTAAWNIWILRNGKVFRNEQPLFRTWRHNFIHDMTLLVHRIKYKYKDMYLAWLSSLP